MHECAICTSLIVLFSYFTFLVSAGGNPLLQGANSRSKNPLLQGPVDYSQSSNPLLRKNGFQLNGQSFVQNIQSFGTGTGFVNGPVINNGPSTTQASVFFVDTTIVDQTPTPPPDEVTNGADGTDVTAESPPPEDTPALPDSTTVDPFFQSGTTMALDSPMKPQTLPKKPSVLNAGDQNGPPASQSKFISSPGVAKTNATSKQVESPTDSAKLISKPNINQGKDLSASNQPSKSISSSANGQNANKSNGKSNETATGNASKNSKPNVNEAKKDQTTPRPVVVGKIVSNVPTPKNPFALSATP